MISVVVRVSLAEIARSRRRFDDHLDGIGASGARIAEVKLPLWAREKFDLHVEDAGYRGFATSFNGSDDEAVIIFEPSDGRALRRSRRSALRPSPPINSAKRQSAA
jgi:hypothetical protein